LLCISSLLHISECGAHIAVKPATAEAPDKCRIRVVAKTPEAATHAKTLVENAFDDIDVDIIDAGRVNVLFTVPTSAIGGLIGKGGSVLGTVESGK
jgi:hypothetical protein